MGRAWLGVAKAKPSDGERPPASPRVAGAAMVLGVLVFLVGVSLAALFGAPDPVVKAGSTAEWQAKPRNTEVWWTTTDCPEGVRVPCLDPGVSVYDIPVWAGGLRSPS